MSYWTYISGTLEVKVNKENTFKNTWQVEKCLEAIKHLKPTGSEGNMSYHILPISHNMLFKKNECIDTFVIILYGYLRDRLIKQTKEEFCAWYDTLHKLASIEISKTNVEIYDDMGEKEVFRNFDKTNDKFSIFGYAKIMPIGRTQEEKEFNLKTHLNHLPVVCDKNSTMYSIVLQEDGFDCSSSTDENQDATFNLIDKKGNRGTRYGWLKLQSMYRVAIDTSFNHTSFDKLKRMLNKWYIRLNKREFIKEINIVVIDNTTEETYVIHSKEW